MITALGPRQFIRTFATQIGVVPTGKLATKGKKRHPAPQRTIRLQTNVTVVLTDGRTVLTKSPRPLTQIELTEDTVTHTLWKKGIAKQFHSSAFSSTFATLPHTTARPQLVSDLFQVPVGGYSPFITAPSTTTAPSPFAATTTGFFTQSLLAAQLTAMTFSNTYTELLDTFITFIKRTYQPSVLKRKRRHGYRARKSTPGGRAILKRRLLKGRHHLTPV